VAVEPFNYETLRKKQQLERGTPRLTKSEPDFYRNLELYLQGLGEDLQREHSANPHGPKATLLQDEMANTRRLAEDLYEHRERKVVTAALTAARGGDARDPNMLREEQELYEALTALLRDAKRRALHGRGSPRAMPAPAPAPFPGSASEPPSTPPPAATSGPPPVPGVQAEAGRLVVRVLEDIASFAASDLRTYSVRREEVVSLPADTAKILILRGKAVEVTPA
jgi:DNA replication initiation complex subunit (GINS family)